MMDTDVSAPVKDGSGEMDDQTNQKANTEKNHQPKLATEDNEPTYVVEVVPYKLGELADDIIRTTLKPKSSERTPVTSEDKQETSGVPSSVTQTTMASSPPSSSSVPDFSLLGGVPHASMKPPKPTRQTSTTLAPSTSSDGTSKRSALQPIAPKPIVVTPVGGPVPNVSIVPRGEKSAEKETDTIVRDLWRQKPSKVRFGKIIVTGQAAQVSPKPIQLASATTGMKRKSDLVYGPYSAKKIAGSTMYSSETTNPQQPASVQTAVGDVSNDSWENNGKDGDTRSSSLSKKYPVLSASIKSTATSVNSVTSPPCVSSVGNTGRTSAVDKMICQSLPVTVDVRNGSKIIRKKSPPRAQNVATKDLNPRCVIICHKCDARFNKVTQFREHTCSGKNNSTPEPSKSLERQSKYDLTSCRTNVAYPKASQLDIRVQGKGNFRTVKVVTNSQNKEQKKNDSVNNWGVNIATSSQNTGQKKDDSADVQMATVAISSQKEGGNKDPSFYHSALQQIVNKHADKRKAHTREAYLRNTPNQYESRLQWPRSRPSAEKDTTPMCVIDSFGSIPAPVHTQFDRSGLFGMAGDQNSNSSGSVDGSSQAKNTSSSTKEPEAVKPKESAIPIPEQKQIVAAEDSSNSQTLNDGTSATSPNSSTKEKEIDVDKGSASRPPSPPVLKPFLVDILKKHAPIAMTHLAKTAGLSSAGHQVTPTEDEVRRSLTEAQTTMKKILDLRNNPPELQDTDKQPEEQSNNIAKTSEQATYLLETSRHDVTDSTPTISANEAMLSSPSSQSTISAPETSINSECLAPTSTALTELGITKNKAGNFVISVPKSYNLNPEGSPPAINSKDPTKESNITKDVTGLDIFMQNELTHSQINTSNLKSAATFPVETPCKECGSYTTNQHFSQCSKFCKPPVESDPITTGPKSGALSTSSPKSSRLKSKSSTACNPRFRVAKPKRTVIQLGSGVFHTFDTVVGRLHVPVKELEALAGTNSHPGSWTKEAVLNQCAEANLTSSPGVLNTTSSESGYGRVIVIAPTNTDAEPVEPVGTNMEPVSNTECNDEKIKEVQEKLVTGVKDKSEQENLTKEILQILQDKGDFEIPLCIEENSVGSKPPSIEDSGIPLSVLKYRHSENLLDKLPVLDQIVDVPIEPTVIHPHPRTQVKFKKLFKCRVCQVEFCTVNHLIDHNRQFPIANCKEFQHSVCHVPLVKLPLGKSSMKNCTYLVDRRGNVKDKSGKVVVQVQKLKILGSKVCAMGYAYTEGLCKGITKQKWAKGRGETHTGYATAYLEGHLYQCPGMLPRPETGARVFRTKCSRCQKVFMKAFAYWTHLEGCLKGFLAN